MSSWSEGYVSDVTYAPGYYREMAPDHLAFAALCLGKSPGSTGASRRILDLGFGMGDGLVLSAATNPLDHYEGCDFNPEHVAHARSLADAAGVTNLTLRETSFQDLAAETREGQQDCDIIQLHGILTWVSAEAHDAILEIARKRLKPGGLLYVSYNCMPGWAPMLPVQRLMREHAKRQGGSSLASTAAARSAVADILSQKGLFFLANPSIEARIDNMAKHAPSYLAHEYLNENWFIFHFADVVKMMARAKLTYLGSATIAENIDNIAVPETMLQTVVQASDPIWKETLRDFASNKQFRRDLYARGLIDLNSAETLAALKETRYTLSMPRAEVKLKFPSPLGELDAAPAIYSPIADLLDGRYATFDEVASLPSLREIGIGGALQALALMIHAGQVLPVAASLNEATLSGQHYNRVVASHAERGRFYGFIAAPVARAGIAVNSTELLILSGVFAGLEDNLVAWADHVGVLLRRVGINLERRGEPLTDPLMVKTVLAKEVEYFRTHKLPLWRHLGAL